MVVQLQLIKVMIGHNISLYGKQIHIYLNVTTIIIHKCHFTQNTRVQI